MSLAAMKRKQKHTKRIAIGYRPDWTSHRSKCYGGNKHIKDSKPSISYEQYTNRLRLGKQSNRGNCNKEIVLDPHKKPHFSDKSAEHRIEILNTNHLKDENVEKLKHQHKVALDGCRDHALNILGDDSDMVRTAEYVLNKRKACLIGKPSEIKTVDNVKGIEDNSLFFVVTGRGSILANMKVEVFVKTDDEDVLRKLDTGTITTSDTGIASVKTDIVSETKKIDKDNINYYILKLVPTDESVNTQKFGDNNEARETKIVLDYFAKIDPEQMNADDDFEITPVTNLIYTIFTISKGKFATLFNAVVAILDPSSEEELQININGQKADLASDTKKRVAMFDLILKKEKVMGTDFWNDDTGSITTLLTDIGSMLLDTYILDQLGGSPIKKDHHEELKTIYHILDVSADKLDSEDIKFDDDDWDDITNTISQIIVNKGYIYEGSAKTEIYDSSVSSDPKTKIFDVSTNFGFLDRGDGSGATDVDYGWRDVSTNVSS